MDVIVIGSIVTAAGAITLAAVNSFLSQIQNKKKEKLELKKMLVEQESLILDNLIRNQQIFKELLKEEK